MKTQLKRFASALRPYVKFIVFAVVLIGFMAWASGSMKAKVKPGAVPFERGAPVPAGAETFSVAVESVVDLDRRRRHGGLGGEHSHQRAPQRLREGRCSCPRASR